MIEQSAPVQVGTIMRIMVLPGEGGGHTVVTSHIVEVLHPLSFNHPNYLGLAGLDPGYHYN